MYDENTMLYCFFIFILSNSVLCFKVGGFGDNGTVVQDFVDYDIVVLDYLFSFLILICREAVSTTPPWLPRRRQYSR